MTQPSFSLSNSPLDATPIVPYLYQGSAPAERTPLAKLGFSVVVFCAKEYQPSQKNFERVECIYAPNDDNSLRPPTQKELHLAVTAAKRVARHIKMKRHVLVTCLAGLNRSGLVSAMVLHLLYGWDGHKCIAVVQDARENALCNPEFCKVLRTLLAKPKARNSAK